MARYSTDHKDTTRKQILDAAGKEFREKGWDGATIPSIMKSAGLTVGGFYKHFDSKSALFAEMFRQTLRDSGERLATRTQTADESNKWEALADAYLTPAHRENLRTGCVMAALASDMPRADAEVKSVFEEEVLAYVDELAGFDSDEESDSRKRAWAFQALMLGGLLLSRGMNTKESAEEVLEACREAVEKM